MYPPGSCSSTTLSRVLVWSREYLFNHIKNHPFFWCIGWVVAGGMGQLRFVSIAFVWQVSKEEVYWESQQLFGVNLEEFIIAILAHSRYQILFLDVEKGDILRHWKFSVIFCWCKSWVVGRKCGIWSAVSFFMSCLFLVGFWEKTVIRIETCTEIRRNEDQWRGTNRNK